MNAQKQRLIIISGSEASSLALMAQVQEFFAKSVKIEHIASDEGYDQTISNALVLVASPRIYKAIENQIDRSCHVIMGQRTLDFTRLDQLYSMPEYSSLLVVNGSKESSREVIEVLKKIGFANYYYYAYYPGGNLIDCKYNFVITPGQSHLVPLVDAPLIDLGPRIFDITTIAEVVRSWGMPDPEILEKLYLVSAKYLEKIIYLGKELDQKHKFIMQIFNNVPDGMVSYAADGKINLINKIATELLGLKVNDNVFDKNRIYNQKLLSYLKIHSPGNSIFQIGSSSYLATIFPNHNNSYLLTLKNVRERINMENQLKKESNKGYRAKYTFNNLVHDSAIMKNLISKCRKLAECDFNILIYGESGTGKEILASAMHNASKRHGGPFLAVNFAALPDSLIESELFGYEDGAFTGAKKSGKVGLFEMANHGTLFLDEIGDISSKIQSRLLRVLQEREILKVGGSVNIMVDVRVIAATNKDLFEMVKQGTFREDLYYRLKKLYVRIPPLRERREDILPLFSHFLAHNDGSNLKLTDEAKAILNSYDWPGNVRELENSVEHILAVCENNTIDTSCLSDDLLREAPSVQPHTNDVAFFVLKLIHKFNEENRLLGRKRLSELSRETRFNLTEDQSRRVLTNLSAQGLVQMSKGRVGLRLTDSGRAHLVGLLGEDGDGDFLRP